MRKLAFCVCENKDPDQLHSNCSADQHLYFATWIVQSLFYLNPKFQASSHLPWFYSLVCVRPGWKPRRPVFSQRGSFKTHSTLLKLGLRGSFLNGPVACGMMYSNQTDQNEPLREKTSLWGFQPGPAQTGLYNKQDG